MSEAKERFELLIEDLRKDFKAAFDGILTLREEMHRGFDNLSKQIKFVDDKVEFVAADLRRVKEDLGRVKEDLGRVKEDLGRVKEDLGRVKEKVDKIDRTLDEHVKLPAHV